MPERMAEIPSDGTLYVICALGGRSRAAAEFLRSNGIDAVNVAGGTNAWVAADFPVETGRVDGAGS
jgi:rhodanese-related sulfurtransferase